MSNSNVLKISKRVQLLMHQHQMKDRITQSRKHHYHCFSVLRHQNPRKKPNASIKTNMKSGCQKLSLSIILRPKKASRKTRANLPTSPRMSKRILHMYIKGRTKTGALNGECGTSIRGNNYGNFISLFYWHWPHNNNLSYLFFSNYQKLFIFYHGGKRILIRRIWWKKPAKKISGSIVERCLKWQNGTTTWKAYVSEIIIQDVQVIIIRYGRKILKTLNLYFSKIGERKHGRSLGRQGIRAYVRWGILKLQ